jgi:hypothetical protein
MMMILGTEVETMLEKRGKGVGSGEGTVMARMTVIRRISLERSSEDIATGHVREREAVAVTVKDHQESLPGLATTTVTHPESASENDDHRPMMIPITHETIIDVTDVIIIALASHVTVYQPDNA